MVAGALLLPRPSTRTPAAAASPSNPASSVLIMVWNTGCRARYTLLSSPLTLSALARLLAVVLSRMVSALRALPATLNTLNKDIFSLLCGAVPTDPHLLTGNGELPFGELAVDERQ